MNADQSNAVLEVLLSEMRTSRVSSREAVARVIGESAQERKAMASRPECRRNFQRLTEILNRLGPDGLVPNEGGGATSLRRYFDAELGTVRVTYDAYSIDLRTMYDGFVRVSTLPTTGGERRGDFGGETAVIDAAKDFVAQLAVLQNTAREIQRLPGPRTRVLTIGGA